MPDVTLAVFSEKEFNEIQNLDPLKLCHDFYCEFRGRLLSSATHRFTMVTFALDFVQTFTIMTVFNSWYKAGMIR